MKLGEIASVRSGLVLSRKQAHAFSGIRYPLLNLRAVNARGYIEEDQIEVYDAVEELSSEYLSKARDVIVRLSMPYTAVLIDEDTAGMVISSNFVHIRANQEILLPEYLYWLINTPEVKKKIYKNTSSNMLGAIKAKFFVDFEMMLLPVSEQRKIAYLNSLAKEECRLLRKLANEKEKYYNMEIKNIYQQMKKGIIT